MHLRTLGAVAVAAVLLPTTATALAAPRDGITPRQAGVGLTWPTRAQRVTLAPGTTVRVAVRSLRSGSAAVVVALTRTDGARPRVVKQRRLRSGSFSARLRKAQGARYVLSARVGRRTLRRLTIVTPKPAPARDSRPSPPTPTPPPALPCTFGAANPAAPAPNTTASATLTGDRAVLSPGETLTLTLANTGTACLSGGVGYTIERRTSDGWERVDLQQVFPALAVLVQPGATRAVVFTAPAGAKMVPGRHRLTQQYSSPVGPVAVAWEFDYTWPNSPHPDSCGPDDGTVGADATTDQPTVANGEQVVVTVSNTGQRCLRGNDMRYGLARQTGPDSWEPVPVVFADLPPRYVRYEPGGSLAFTVPIADAARMPPGRYRFSYELTVPPTSDAIQTLMVFAEFDVVALPD